MTKDTTRPPRTEAGRGAVALMPALLSKEVMRRLVMDIEAEAAAPDRSDEQVAHDRLWAECDRPLPHRHGSRVYGAAGPAVDPDYPDGVIAEDYEGE